MNARIAGDEALSLLVSGKIDVPIVCELRTTNSNQQPVMRRNDKSDEAASPNDGDILKVHGRYQCGRVDRFGAKQHLVQHAWHYSGAVRILPLIFRRRA